MKLLYIFAKKKKMSYDIMIIDHHPRFKNSKDFLTWYDDVTKWDDEVDYNVILFTFAQNCGLMEKILKVHSVNDYARYIGAPELHPLVSVIHYDELEHCRHSLNNYDVFGIFIGDETLDELKYGLQSYTLHRHALMCVSPGQIGGKTDMGEEIQTKGWALLFDPALLSGTELARHLPSYTYFSYNISEALLMSDEQRQIIVTLLEAIRTELQLADDDSHQRHILVHLIGLILEYIARFYEQQLSTKTKESDDLLLRFETLSACSR